MNSKHKFLVGAHTLVAMIMVFVLVVACGGGGGGGGGTATTTPTTTPNASYPRSSPGTLISPPTTGSNVLPIVVDAGPVSGAREVNVPYVSVTVCTPGASGSTAACQTIDHVLLDTGSSGLRLLNSTLYSNLNLPVVINSGGKAIGECEVFGTGTTWGSVLLADIYLGGEVARSVSIQDAGDQPGGATAVPADCSGTGTINNTAALLGANGILGVGLFTNDCDACLTQSVPATYYTCTPTGCTGSTVTSAQVVKNPVALFSQDNNGVLIQLPAVSNASATTSLAGSLIFGIGTQTNGTLPGYNALGGATVYATDAYGNFRTTFNSVLMSQSFIDSGSNGLFFHDSSIPTCTVNTWAYCPTSSPMSLSATIANASGTVSSPLVNFTIVGLDSLAGNVVAANIGGPNISTQFDWGLPFFFGRPVFTAISGASTPRGTGPYFAY